MTFTIFIFTWILLVKTALKPVNQLHGILMYFNFGNQDLKVLLLQKRWFRGRGVS